MSGLPKLPVAQKYQLVCCNCGGTKLARGVTNIAEPDAEEGADWSSNEVVTEYQCSRQTCGAVNYLVARATPEGTFFWWRSIKNDPKKRAVGAV